MTLVERQNIVVFSFLNFFFNIRNILAQYFLLKNLFKWSIMAF